LTTGSDQLSWLKTNLGVIITTLKPTELKQKALLSE